MRPAIRNRLLTSVLLAAGIAVFVWGFVGVRSGRPDGLPDAIVSFTPGPGDRVLRQAGISVELKPIYTGTLIIDGQEVVPKFAKAQRNILTFQAGPGAEITEFHAGTHSVRLEYWRQTESRATAQSYFWAFSTS